MATLTIRNVDDETKAKLRQRAALHDRSMEEEVRVILRRAVVQEPSESSASGAEFVRRIRSRLRDSGGFELEIEPRESGREPPEFGAVELASEVAEPLDSDG